jgi:hypothetical protein
MEGYRSSAATRPLAAREATLETPEGAEGGKEEEWWTRREVGQLRRPARPEKWFFAGGQDRARATAA